MLTLRASQINSNMAASFFDNEAEFADDDDETSPLTQDIYNGSQRTVHETKAWDVFRDLPPKQDSGSMESQKCLDFTIKVLKIVVYFVTFAVILCCGVISKGCVFLMAAQIQPGRYVPYCNKDLGRDKQFVTRIPMEEQVAWTWCLFIAFCIPELSTLIRSLRICFFKSWRRPLLLDFIFVCTMETLHVVGVASLVFYVLPSLDVIRGAMITNCLCFIPAFLTFTSTSKKNLTKNSQRYTIYGKFFMNGMTLLIQTSGLVVWPLLEKDASLTELLIIPITLFLISCGYWENFVTRQTLFGLLKPAWRIKDRLKRTRNFSNIFIATWKILCFFCAMIMFRSLHGNNIVNLFSMVSKGFSSHTVQVYEIKPSADGLILPDLKDVLPTGESTSIEVEGGPIIYVLLTQIICSYLCYIFGKFACKIMIQGFSYAFPVNLTVPIALSLLISACGLRNGDPCIFHNFIPDYLFFAAPDPRFLNGFIYSEYAWIWLFWLASQTWVTFHLWTPKCERLATTEKLFVRPWYDALLIDQSLAFNRTRDDENNVKTEELADREKDPEEYYETISIHTETSSTTTKTVKKTDSITRIYACATMWHETREEMMDMLKSILRMDEDQCARRVAQKYLRVVDPDYYEFETHIFLDDAFEISDINDDWSQVNRFVKMLVATIDEAATHVHETNIRIKPPTKYPTPYGGRLMWVLPGKTKLFVHLKDKSKIRHRKRWSQVMYMYYLLGHRLMELPIPVERKEVMAENTYLLTLDGDVDFQPHAVQLLIDLMKKNRNLGAACGRIHPVGSGLMAWYQVFEYAIGHWLQKATEHMIGCVLCSPGCFSLFRGKALMDDNVMRKYTTKSQEARHYVQYDQGEDRWLCTLLLQRGYRVEYSAASDAYTHCPESFTEFFNQRRRWVPSTIANIFDLLQSSKRTIKINDNISLPYIAYQFMLMGGTILGPGTIFLMLVGAFVAVFHIDNWTSFYYNIFPILFFMFVCFTCKSKVQLLVAHMLSTIYALIMMAVIVGTALQLREDGIGSPSAIFLISMLSSFFIAALLHPQEFSCIIFFSIYLLSIPAMYLLLILYSIINLNNVTWGTREVQVKKTKMELEQEKKMEEEAKRKAKSKSLLGLFLQNNSDGTEDNEEGSLEISFAGLFKCMFCTHQKAVDERQQLMTIATSMDAMSKRMEHIEKSVCNLAIEYPAESQNVKHRTPSTVSVPHLVHNSAVTIVAPESIGEHDEGGSDTTIASMENVVERNDDINPFWIEDKDLKKGPVGFISPNENQFWKDLIEKYLYPIDEDKTEKARIATDLKNLRDQMVFAFFMINALFVVIVFLLQLNKDQLHIKWPFGVKTNITYDETTQEARIAADLIELRNKCVFAFFMLNALFVLVVFLLQLNKEDLHINWPLGVRTNITYIEETAEVLISKEYLQLEPIGLVFVFFFAFILVIQFSGMMMHRFGTISHILASTELDCCRKKKEDPSRGLNREAVDLVRRLQRLKGINGDYENSSGSSGDRVGQRRTIYNLEKQKNKTRTIGTLDVAFRKRFFALEKDGAPVHIKDTAPGLERQGVRPEMLEALEVRRRSMQAERRKSQMQTLGLNNGIMNNNRSQRVSASGVNVKDIFEGHHNMAYEHDEGRLIEPGVRLQTIPRTPIPDWNE